MMDFMFNPAKGSVVERWRQLLTLPNSRVWLIPVVVGGAVTVEQLRDCATFAEYLAVGPTELTTDGWERKPFDQSTVVEAQVNQAEQRMELIVPPGVWVSVPETATPSTDLVVCHSAMAAPTNEQLVPLSHHDFPVTPAGGNIEINWGPFHYAA